MSNPMRYIKALEAAGFQREQAEAQVQMVFDALETDIMTKKDFVLFEERLDRRFEQFEQHFEYRLIQTEMRLLTRLGFLTVSTTSIAVVVLTWLIKIKV